MVIIYGKIQSKPRSHHPSILGHILPRRSFCEHIFRSRLPLLDFRYEIRITLEERKWKARIKKNLTNNKKAARHVTAASPRIHGDAFLHPQGHVTTTRPFRVARGDHCVSGYGAGPPYS
ncbi:hypothetical protein AVEN_205559-1 [Araneus ventricosus]|uniref:Uncharacterized protein n=1 Tax=Araneus ventricosus TaxID=182803 RepID=A0A4Y2U952_ARAVE|nr:hypothetical protein AVEN_205559-1 [Araneus ventricosus]